MDLYKTGQKVENAGDYRFVRYVENDPIIPPPTPEERIIPLDVGDRFPPVRSTGKAAWWRGPV